MTIFCQNFFLKNSFFILPLLVIGFCGSSLAKPNDDFEKKYGKEVKKIKLQQTNTASNNNKKNQPITLYPPTLDEINKDVFSQESLYYPYVDVAKFGQDLPKNYFPNHETYEQARAQKNLNSLPENLFEVSYDTNLYPSFSKFGAEFDAIIIPPHDVYGVKTKLENKPYLLAGNKFLQKSIDQINSEKTKEDIEMSEILIKEQKKINLERRMIEVSDEESFENSSSKKMAIKKDKPTDKNKVITDKNKAITDKTTAETLPKKPANQNVAANSAKVAVGK
jgi:hypothetical protein